MSYINRTWPSIPELLASLVGLVTGRSLPVTATIANGASLSNAIEIGDYILVNGHGPAAWTAASLTVRVSFDGGTTYVTFKTIATGAVTTDMLFTANEMIVVANATHIRFLSGTVAAPVNQLAARVFTLNLKA